jgi:hypothetical protein
MKVDRFEGAESNQLWLLRRCELVDDAAAAAAVFAVVAVVANVDRFKDALSIIKLIE